MVNIIFFNEKSKTKAEIQGIKEVFESVFKYTSEVNIHIFLNFKSPVDTLGVYDYLFFIEIPYRQGNYFRTNSNVYLNNIVFAIRKIADTSITKVEDGKMYSESGEFDYEEQIESERKALNQFIYDNITDVRRFDFALYYLLDAPNCTYKGFCGNLLCNPINVHELISKTINDLKGEKLGTTCVSLPNEIFLSNVIYKFIEATEARTNHGILTKKKIEAISTKQIGTQMATLYESAGTKLGMISGKAGTGKSLALLRFMYNHVQEHHCRLLTYNNLLVMDTKMALRNIGDFSPVNASITTLHKFFYSIYKTTPVYYLHMDDNQVNRLFRLCHSRIIKMVGLIEMYALVYGFTNDVTKILNYYKSIGFVLDSEQKEMHLFAEFLAQQKNWSVNDLYAIMNRYVQEKRERFVNDYQQKAFLSGYRIIIEQLYLLFHNSDEFLEKFGNNILIPHMSIRKSGRFQKDDEQLYDKFIEQCTNKFAIEHGIPEDLIPQFFTDEEELINKISNEKIGEQIKEQFKNAIETKEAIKAIKRKVYWSKYVLIDEAQDCANYEKELLLELFGSSNIIIASGGKDQLIRTPTETRWDVSFGTRLYSEKISLTHVSHRQKGNVVEFINAFAKEFRLDTELSVPDSIKGTGKVIIDMRKGISRENMPLDIINYLRIYGEDYGCSPYESMMMLFPNQGYTTSTYAGSTINIDKNDTISYDVGDRVRSLEVSLPEGMSALDCSINGKSTLLAKAGHDKTRCLLYQSCRGLEAWSVLCFGFDKFFAEKQIGKAVNEYIDEALGLFKDDEQQRFIQREKYASLWLFMALTRAMDTLYISFENPDSYFAKRILQIGSNLPFVEILK